MLRRFSRRYRRYLFLAGCVYILMSFWILGELDADSDGLTEAMSVFNRVYDPFGSRFRLRDVTFESNLHDVIKRLTNQRKDGLRQQQEQESCEHNTTYGNADIQMEEVWDRVSVGYPKLVLSVTGWVDTIKVTSWTSKPLHVIVVPHSHQDPGWLQTADRYYKSFTQRTLDILVQRLKVNPTWKFIWSETVFLHRWWQTATSEQRNNMKSLIDKGQLELVTGGWVMPDEAVTHYMTLIDQLTEGHQWIQNTFNVTIKTGWAIDPFGHSSTMPYLLQNAGMQNMVIQRVHFAVKRLFAREKDLEFYWKQQWGNHGNGILCHMMPFLLYSIPYSCGPDRHVCCKFDFNRQNCFQGTQRRPTISVTDENIDNLAQSLWEQLQKKSELYRSHVVLLPHGDDFRYDKNAEWDSQFSNLEKLMNYINRNKEMDMKIEFGTLADYFKALHDDKLSFPSKDRFPTLTGDFLTYADRGDQYWSGLYTTRPYLKLLLRKLQYHLRMAECMYTFSRIDGPMNNDLYRKLESARRGSAVHLHHDVITGTSREHVIKDYIERIKYSIMEARDVYTASMQNLLTRHCLKTDKSDEIIIIQMDKENKNSNMDEHILVSPYPRTILMFSNLLGLSRVEVIQVAINTSHVIVVDGHQTPVTHQISPMWNTDGSIDTSSYLLAFEVKINAYTVSPYFIVPRDDPDVHKITRIEYYRQNDPVKRTADTGDTFRMFHSNNTITTLSNDFLTAVITTKDGFLKYVHNHSKGRFYKNDIHFVAYSTGRNSHPFSDKSGAYIFLPDGVAKELDEDPVSVSVIKGPVFSQVRTVLPSVTHIVTIFNTSGPVSRGIHIENVVNINNKKWNNREIVMRVETNIHDEDHTLCTDVNGFQLQRRKTRAKLTIQGNFYPMTTTAFMENKDSRVTLLSKNPHGVASLVSGWLDVVLDRRLIQDDWRGLNENVTDNVPVKSSFILLFEERIGNKLQTSKPSDPCLPSDLSNKMSEMFNNPPVISAVVPPSSSSSSSAVCTPTIMLAEDLPCNYHILNFRMLPHSDVYKQALVVIHHRGIDCDFAVSSPCKNKTVWSFQDISSLTITDVTETSLTGVEVRRILKPDDPIYIPPMEIQTFKITFR